MAMNKYMHPRNPYKTASDFKQLALEYTEFRKYALQDLSGKIKLNFKNDGAVWTLTKCLLHKDFGLTVETIPGRLVPTLPLRLNYILWLEDILRLHKSSHEKVTGIDIGTGACCIYPLLSAKTFSWNMLCTEVESENYECALANIKRNNLQDLIIIKKVEETMFLSGVLDDDVKYDFCMCNPPFFNDNEEIKNRSGGRAPPRNAHSGTPVELIAEGGEVAFVKSIIQDSFKLKEQVKVYTTMLGHKSSLQPLKSFIKEVGAAKLSSTMFCQGRTTRWGLAWSYDPGIDLDSADIQKKLKKKTDDYIRFQNFPLHNETDNDELVEKIIGLLQKLMVEIECVMSIDEVQIYYIKAKENTWINKRKRRREEKRKCIPTDLEQSENLKSENTSTMDDMKKSEVKPQTKALEDKESTVDKETPSSSGSKGNQPNEETEESNNKHKLETDGGPFPKKIKIDETEKVNNLYLHCSFAFKNLDDTMQLEAIYIDGTGGKDALNQLLQYIKSSIT